MINKIQSKWEIKQLLKGFFEATTDLKRRAHTKRDETSSFCLRTMPSLPFHPPTSHFYKILALHLSQRQSIHLCLVYSPKRGLIRALFICAILPVRVNVTSKKWTWGLKWFNSQNGLGQTNCKRETVRMCACAYGAHTYLIQNSKERPLWTPFLYFDERRKGKKICRKYPCCGT